MDRPFPNWKQPRNCEDCGKPLGQELRRQGLDRHVRDCRPKKKKPKKSDGDQKIPAGMLSMGGSKHRSAA